MPPGRPFIFIVLALPVLAGGGGCATGSAAGKWALTPNSYRQTLERAEASLPASAHLARIKTEVLAPASWSGASIERIHGEWRTLPRNEMSRSELLELKLGLQHWRVKGRSQLLKALLASSTVEEVEGHMTSLVKMGAVLTADELLAVGTKASLFPEKRSELLQGLAALLVLQGDHRKTQAVLAGLPAGFQPFISPHADGPALVPDIPASRESDWTAARILETPELSRYLRSPEGLVIFRGLQFRPGDFLLVNLANPSEGLFTSFTAEENLAFHLGLYVELERDGLLFPCVYESYEHGTRIVPLVTYLSPAHTLFVEVFRPQALPAGSAERLGKAVVAALEKEHGFNLFLEDARSQEGHYITCTTAVTQILEQAGLPTPRRRTPIHPNAQLNLSRIGLVASEILTPSDFLLLDEPELMGWIDNQEWERLLASTLTTRYLSEQLQEKRLDPEDDTAFRFYRFGSRRILNDTFVLGGLLRWAFGFSEGNFPTGDPSTLAFVLRVEEEMDAAVERVEKELTRHRGFYEEAPWFSVHAARQDPTLSSLIASSFAVTGDWFRPDPAARAADPGPAGTTPADPTPGSR